MTHSKTWVLTGKQFEDFRPKKEQNQSPRLFNNTSSLKTTNLCDIYCARYKIVSLGPENSIEMFKKSSFPLKKKFWPLFSHTTEQDRLHGKIYNGPQRLPTKQVYALCLCKFVQALRLFLQYLRGLYKQTFQKGYLPCDYGLIFGL